ncbi:MAG: lasso RiPP family leader peptide-containing protein [Acidobacteriota bacterium]|nr:lasso RiPP family leader peptide-containing protein [Acidobacteriota bacterium]
MTNDQQNWETPALTVYGDVAALTLAKDKHSGSSDGFTFNGVPISG